MGDWRPLGLGGRGDCGVCVGGLQGPKEVPMEERFETIEIKVAFLEKSLEELDDVVRTLSSELDESHKEIKWLREKVLSVAVEAQDPAERA